MCTNNVYSIVAIAHDSNPQQPYTCWLHMYNQCIHVLYCSIHKCILCNNLTQIKMIPMGDAHSAHRGGGEPTNNKAWY